MVEDRRHEAPSDLRRRGLGDPVVEILQMLLSFRRVVDSARHERAAHLASKRVLTSLAGTARDGSAFNASYAAAASVRSQSSAARRGPRPTRLIRARRRATSRRTVRRQGHPRLIELRCTERHDMSLRRAHDSPAPFEQSSTPLRCAKSSLSSVHLGNSHSSPFRARPHAATVNVLSCTLIDRCDETGSHAAASSPLPTHSHGSLLCQDAAGSGVLGLLVDGSGKWLVRRAGVGL